MQNNYNHIRDMKPNDLRRYLVGYKDTIVLGGFHYGEHIDHYYSKRQRGKKQRWSIYDASPSPVCPPMQRIAKDLRSHEALSLLKILIATARQGN